MIHRLLCVVVLVALSLTGCSTVNRWFGRDSTVQARQGRSLEVPPSMSRATTTDLMSIPENGRAQACRFPPREVRSARRVIAVRFCVNPRGWRWFGVESAVGSRQISR